MLAMMALATRATRVLKPSPIFPRGFRAQSRGIVNARQHHRPEGLVGDPVDERTIAQELDGLGGQMRHERSAHRHGCNAFVHDNASLVHFGAELVRAHAQFLRDLKEKNCKKKKTPGGPKAKRSKRRQIIIITLNLKATH